MVEYKPIEQQLSAEAFPRVLILNASCIYEQDSHGLFFRTLFADWPKEQVAQICTGGEGTGGPFFKLTYKLGAKERKLGHFLYRLKSPVLSRSTGTKVRDKYDRATSGRVTGVKILLYRLSHQLISAGFWEFLFAPKLSRQLAAWVESFAPDVIYYQGGLAMGWLTRKLQDEYGIPVVFHPVDDWPNRLYRRNPIMHRVVLRTAQSIINRAASRIAFCQRMAEGYEVQFGRQFEAVIMHGDDNKRFEQAAPKSVDNDNVISIVYSGGLGHRRWQSLLDVCEAVEQLKIENFSIKITAYVGILPTDIIKKLSRQTNLQVRPALAHDEVPAYLKSADILLLAEPFDERAAIDVRYSVSTKAHLYMMSQKPILVYGSPEAGVVNYAIRDGWGYVVTEQRKDSLVDAIRKLSANHETRSNLIGTAHNVVLRNHTKSKNLDRFLSVMQSATKSGARNKVD